MTHQVFDFQNRKICCSKSDNVTNKALIVLKDRWYDYFLTHSLIKPYEFIEQNIDVYTVDTDSMNNKKEWNISTDFINNEDVSYLSNFISYLKNINENSYENIQLVGLGLGGQLALTLLIGGYLNAIQGTWVISSLMSINQYQKTLVDLTDIKIHLVNGTEDSIYPNEGYNLFFQDEANAYPETALIASLEMTVNSLESANAVLNTISFNGGHCWPSGFRPLSYQQYCLDHWNTEFNLNNSIINSFNS